MEENELPITLKLHEAMIIALTFEGRGMSTDTLADYINKNKLYIRKDGQPVTSEQVYAVTCRYRNTFIKEGGIFHLSM